MDPSAFAFDIQPSGAGAILWSKWASAAARFAKSSPKPSFRWPRITSSPGAAAPAAVKLGVIAPECLVEHLVGGNLGPDVL